jgi:eukaryotic-like serine/threonine-protein kinase
VAVLDLRRGQWKTLVRGGNQAEYVNDASGSGPGYLLYATAGTLRAVRFDLTRLEVQSDPVMVVEQLMTKPSGAANYAVSRRTALVYVPPEAGDQNPMRSLVWVDRKGREEPLRAAPTRGYGPPRVSPDGKRMAIGIIDQGRTNVWIWDFALETLKPLTSASGMNGLPVWTLDGQRIIFMSDRTGVLNLYSQAADFTGTAVQITTSASSQWPTSITRDGEWIVAFERRPRTTSSDIVAFPLTSPGTRPQSSRARALIQSPEESIGAIRLNGSWAAVSPNGRYLAYQSRESGREEIYVRPFPEVDRERWQISTGGGTRAVWARDGLELFYLDESGALIGVRVRTSGPRFVAGTPATIFDTVYAEPNPARHYDVSADGRRFLMLKDRAADPNATPASLVVVDHWFGGLQWHVPARGK